MKSPLTNISVARHPPRQRAMNAEGDAETGNGPTGAIAPPTVNITGAITYTGSSSVTISGDVNVIGMVESEFLSKFREKFAGNGAPKPWPRQSTNTPAEFCTEFTDVLRALFLRNEGSVTPPDGAPGSAKQIIKELIAETDWPADSPKAAVPEPWNSNGQSAAFRRYEISCAIYILMRTFDGLGSGGGSTPFPPDH